MRITTAMQMRYNYTEVISMSGIPNSYTALFNAVTDAIALINEMNFGAARETLKQGQCLAEDLYMGETEDERRAKAWMKKLDESMRKESAET